MLNAIKATLTVEEYLSGRSVNVLKSASQTVDRARTVIGLAHRAIGLVQGLSRLNRIAHIQLTLAANRAMLEVLVDLILIVHDKPPEAVEQIEAWELSAKLKAASATVKFVQEKGKVSELEQPLIDFIAREKEKVKDLRGRFWPKTEHPPRWTGRDLLADVIIADREKPLGLEWYYQTEYRRMNWGVHGSGLAGFRGIDLSTLDVWFNLSHKKTSEFALEALQLAYSDLGLFTEAVKADFEAACERWQIALLLD